MGLSEIAECFQEGRIDAQGVVRSHLERVRKERDALGRLESILSKILFVILALEACMGGTLRRSWVRLQLVA